MMRIPMRAAIAVSALVLLNAMLAFANWWPTPAIRPDWRLAPEFTLLWVALLGWVAWRGGVSRRALGVLAALYLLLVFGRYFEVTVPALFGRPINLYWDGAQIPRFVWVAAQDIGLAPSIAALAVVLALLWAVHRLVRAALAVVVRDAVPYALRARWTWGITALALMVVVANLAGVRATWPIVAKPVTPTYWRQAQLLAAAFVPARADAVLPRETAIDAALAAPAGQALGALAGRDLYLVMLESYGAVAYDDPRAVRVLAPARERLAADIAASGRQVVSAFLRSPTFGGASELAHLGVLAGMDLRDPLRHDVLLTSERPTLMTLFRAHGYRTFGLYPALSWVWPERVFYGFDVFLDGRDLGWRGPNLGAWWIPDQYTLARFEAMHPRDRGAPPRLVFFPTITSHFPFSPVPPYQPDWRRVLGPEPFESEETRRALAATPNWLDMFPEYAGMMAYQYRWLGGFFNEPEPRETVFVLVGDHQPTANITGEGVSWDVPVHVVSRDAALLARFVERGFHPGLEPPRASLGELHSLTAIMLDAFARRAPAEAPPAGAAQVQPPRRPGRRRRTGPLRAITSCARRPRPGTSA